MYNKLNSRHMIPLNAKESIARNFKLFFDILYVLFIAKVKHNEATANCPELKEYIASWSSKSPLVENFISNPFFSPFKSLVAINNPIPCW